MSLSCSQFPRRSFLCLLPMYRMVPGWTLLQVFSGGMSECAFINVHIFHQKLPVPCLLVIRSMKALRKAKGQRIRESEYALFTLILISATGGWLTRQLTLYLMSCFLVVLQAGNEYSVVWGWLQCLLSFSLLRSAI